ncbi:MAG: FMN-binding protein [Lachnospiraceae bacterium]|nr:FMN-binding protein [Lachnospiraceae bacterium]
MKKKSTFVKDTLALTIITLVAGLCLAFVNEITKGPIAEAEQRAKTAAYYAVYADAEKFDESEDLNAYIKSGDYTKALSSAGVKNASVIEAYEAVDASGNVIGYVMSAKATKAFDGDLTISIGVSNEGKVTGIEFIDIHETAGMGMNAKDKPEWRTQFYGQDADSFTVGENIEGLSGATITSKAVTSAVNSALVLAKGFGGK